MTLTPQQAGDSTLRDNLAELRTQMANERTLLAYSRTSLMLLATGGTILKLLADTLSFQVLGWILIASGIAIAVLGARRYRQYQRQFSSDSGGTEEKRCQEPFS